MFTANAPTSGGNPAKMAACRAGACPEPAVTTCPMMTSSICVGSMPARSTATFTAAAPSLGAGIEDNTPMNFPMGVRAPERITASFSFLPSVVM